MAVDPARPATVVAGSNDVEGETMRVYESVDGGRSWTSASLPRPKGRGLCGESDPALSVDAGGRRYFGFIGLVCRGKALVTTTLYLASQPRAGGRWTVRPVRLRDRGKLTLADDRPAVAVDTGAASERRGRVYMAWTRFRLDPSSFFVDPDESDVDYVEAEALVSHSDDGGATWSAPVALTRRGLPIDVHLAVGRDGAVYAVWREAKTNSVSIATSADGKSFGSPHLVAPAVVVESSRCHTARARIAAQPLRCVSSNPVVSVDTRAGQGRVYVTWASASLNRSQDVYVAAFDESLKPLLGVGEVKQVNPPESFRGPGPVPAGLRRRPLERAALGLLLPDEARREDEGALHVHGLRRRRAHVVDAGARDDRVLRRDPPAGERRERLRRLRGGRRRRRKRRRRLDGRPRRARTRRGDLRRAAPVAQRMIPSMSRKKQPTAQKTAVSVGSTTPTSAAAGPRAAAAAATPAPPSGSSASAPPSATSPDRKLRGPIDGNRTTSHSARTAAPTTKRSTTAYAPTYGQRGCTAARIRLRREQVG